MATSLSSAARLFTPKPRSFFSKPISNPCNLSFISPISFQQIKTKAQIQPQDQIFPSNASSPLLDLSVLPPKLFEIISLFQSIPDPKTQYQQLLHNSTQLPPLDSQFKTEANRVQGCVSRVWVCTFQDPQEGDNGAEPAQFHGSVARLARPANPTCRSTRSLSSSPLLSACRFVASPLRPDLKSSWITSSEPARVQAESSSSWIFSSEVLCSNEPSSS